MSALEPSASPAGEPRDGDTLEALLTEAFSGPSPFSGPSSSADHQRLLSIAGDMVRRKLPRRFILAGLRSTAAVMRDLRDEESRAADLFQREDVRRFIQQNAVADGARDPRYSQRSERKREERERLQANAQKLLREARQSRGRHEVKKTRNMLLKLDQREIRRVLGGEGDELCRQINTWLRSTAQMF